MPHSPDEAAQPAPLSSPRAPSDRFARGLVLVTGVTWLVFAAWLTIDPAAVPRAFGVEEVPPGLRTELRAFYGGVEAGLGLTILMLWRRDLRAAALLGALPLLGSAVMRAAGCLLEGFVPIHAILGVPELLGGGLNAWVWWALESRTPRSPVHSAPE